MRLHHSLEKTVQACEKFRLQATDYFQCVSISEILYTMNELDMLDRELDALVARCKFFARMVSGVVIKFLRDTYPGELSKH